MAAHIVTADTGGFRELSNPDPNLEIHCGGSWSRGGQRLACETFGVTDPSRNGIYTIRSSDGGGLTRVTSNPGGDDIQGDYAPNGKRLVFARFDDPTDRGRLYVVKVGDNLVRPITPPGTLVSSSGDWSPQGNEIVFSQHSTPDTRSSLWVVHADGTGLHEIPVHAQPALRRRLLRSELPRLLRAALVTRRQEDRLRQREVPKRQQHLHGQRRRNRPHPGHARGRRQLPGLGHAPIDRIGHAGPAIS